MTIHPSTLNHITTEADLDIHLSPFQSCETNPFNKSHPFSSGAPLAQSGKVFDNLSITSKILNGERKYAVYLPPDYETSQRSYPVLYLLHGGGDDQTGWVQFGEVLHITDKAINDGSATSMIIVMPDANTGRRGYTNDIKGTWQYEDFFFNEFIPYIEKTYRIKSEKRYRAVAGLSMGGTALFSMHCTILRCSRRLVRSVREPVLCSREIPEKTCRWFLRTPLIQQLQTALSKHTISATASSTS